MTPCRALFFVAPLVLLIVIAGCGGGGARFDPNKVTVTVSPSGSNGCCQRPSDIAGYGRRLC